jgi:hypothetical protein
MVVSALVKSISMCHIYVAALFDTYEQLRTITHNMTMHDAYVDRYVLLYLEYDFIFSREHTSHVVVR